MRVPLLRTVDIFYFRNCPTRLARTRGSGSLRACFSEEIASALLISQCLGGGPPHFSLVICQSTLQGPSRPLIVHLA